MPFVDMYLLAGFREPVRRRQDHIRIGFIVGSEVNRQDLLRNTEA
jgi:hypothetical protein